MCRTWLIASAATWLSLCALAHAQEPAAAQLPATFQYTTPAEKNYVRGLLELSAVVTFGFLWYVTQTDIARDGYDVNYSWPVFRAKLSGEALALDTNELGTNYVGHPIGGAMYYTAMRSNQLSILESFSVAVGGSLLWEYFGEVHEIVSLNDMIVTPLAGLAIAEPLMQLGAFFDRSSPRLHNRILGVFFAPLKSLNDLLDGRVLARTSAVDAEGFPEDEWHQFDLLVAAGATDQQPSALGLHDYVTREWRLSLSSKLARLPSWARAGRHSLTFDEGQVSSIDVQLAASSIGLVDVNIATQFVLVGHYLRTAALGRDGKLWGNGMRIGLTVGYQYTMHDYDRDAARPRDRIGSVQPLGLALEHRAELGLVQLTTRVDAGGEFAGVRPYALRAYRLDSEAPELPTLLREHLYYFGVGGHFLGELEIAVDTFEAQARVRLDAYHDVGSSVSASDRRTLVSGRASCGFPRTPLRVGLFVERRWRSGWLARAHAARYETSTGVELGGRF